MQAFGNLASQPERRVTKTTNKGYYEFRLAESQRGVDNSTTWYTVRVMLDENPKLNKGDFVKVTGKLKTDFYLSREGQPTGTLLIIAFDASKVFKLTAVPDGEKSVAAVVPKEAVKEKAPAVQQVRLQEPVQEKIQAQARERQVAAVAQEESDWSTLYS